MEPKKVKYSEAIAEIEDIINKLNNPSLDIDSLSGYVERATALISQCRERLLKVQEQVEQVLESNPQK